MGRATTTCTRLFSLLLIERITSERLSLSLSVSIAFPTGGAGITGFLRTSGISLRPQPDPLARPLVPISEKCSLRALLFLAGRPQRNAGSSILFRDSPTGLRFVRRRFLLSFRRLLFVCFILFFVIFAGNAARSTFLRFTQVVRLSSSSPAMLDGFFFLYLNGIKLMPLPLAITSLLVGFRATKSTPTAPAAAFRANVDVQQKKKRTRRPQVFDDRNKKRHLGPPLGSNRVSRVFNTGTFF